MVIAGHLYFLSMFSSSRTTFVMSLKFFTANRCFAVGLLTSSSILRLSFLPIPIINANTSASLLTSRKARRTSVLDPQLYLPSVIMRTTLLTLSFGRTPEMQTLSSTSSQGHECQIFYLTMSI